MRLNIAREFAQSIVFIITYRLGLNKKGEKAEHLKTDKIKSESVKGGTGGVDLSNFSPEEMKKIMEALQTAPGTNPSEGKGEGTDAKLNQGLRQMLDGASGVEPKPGSK